MNVTIESQNPGERVLLIEVQEERARRAIDEAYRRISQSIFIPGFRKGKAPKNIIDLHVGKTAIYERALEKILPECFKEAVLQLNIEPFDAPNMEIVDFEEGKPLKFRATVEVRPKVTEMGQYKGLDVKMPPVVVSEETVNKEMENFRRAHAELVDLGEEHEVLHGNVAFLEFRTQSGEPLEEEERKRVEGLLQQVSPGGYMIRPQDECTDVEKQILGLRPSEERNITVGNTGMSVVVTSVKEMKMPELNDDFAKTMGPYDSLEELRYIVENSLRRSASIEASKKVREEILERISEKSNVEIPKSLIERRLGSLVSTIQAINARMLETNPELVKEDPEMGVLSENKIEEIRDRNRPGIELDIKKDLIIYDLAAKENIQATDAEVSSVLEGIAEERGQDLETLKEEMIKSGGLESIRAGIIREKVFDFLVSENVIDDDNANKEDEDAGETAAQNGETAAQDSGDEVSDIE
jgi:trigger factor